MKKLIITSAIAAIMTMSIVTAQTSYACFCISGIIWESACGPQPSQPTQPPTDTTTTPPADTTDTPTTPTTDTPSTPTTDTPTTPTPVADVTTPETPAPAPAKLAAVVPAELPQTGISESFLAMTGLGILTYAGVYVSRLIKR